MAGSDDERGCSTGPQNGDIVPRPQLRARRHEGERARSALCDQHAIEGIAVAPVGAGGLVKLVDPGLIPGNLERARSASRGSGLLLMIWFPTVCQH